MSDLADFLLARIAEDESVARMRQVERIAGPNDYVAFDIGAEVLALVVAPDRVLAECEAKRRIVEALIDMEPVEEERKEQVVTLRWACEMLAHPYADHPDYNPDWRP